MGSLTLENQASSLRTETLVVTLRLHCGYIAVTLRLYCSYIAVTLRLHGGYIVLGHAQTDVDAVTVLLNGSAQVSWHSVTWVLASLMIFLCMLMFKVCVCVCVCACVSVRGSQYFTHRNLT